jgi:predicted DNA-binding protein with PD1-like motif
MMNATSHNILPSGAMRAHAVRLEPGEDLVPSLIEASKKAMMSASSSGAAFVLSAVGSLSKVSLRLATASNGDGGDILQLDEKLEILSMVGTFSQGEKHIHMSVANGMGTTFGGHLMAGIVFTTVELVLGTIENVTFSREHDERTGYTELVVKQTALKAEALDMS